MFVYVFRREKDSEGANEEDGGTKGSIVSSTRDPDEKKKKRGLK